MPCLVSTLSALPAHQSLGTVLRQRTEQHGAWEEVLLSFLHSSWEYTRGEATQKRPRQSISFY